MIKLSVTIKDIANVAGVSYSTVSKALNDSPLVKEKTKQKIIKISKEMGYKPNFAARSLVSNQTKVIGLIWPTIERVVLSTLVTKISHEMNKTPYSMILSVDPIETALETFRRFQVDGIILFEENIDMPVHSKNTSLLAYGVTREGKLEHPVIDPNHDQAMHMAVEYLTSLGHEKIAYIGDLSSHDLMQIEKYKGFKKAMRNSNLVVDGQYVIDTHGLDWYDGYAATNAFFELSDRPTAIVGGSYDISGGITRGILERKLSIPDDISVISYDNIPQMATMEVPMTAIGVPVDQLALEIVQSIIRLVEDNAQEPFSHKIQPVLEKRSSCARIK